MYYRSFEDKKSYKDVVLIGLQKEVGVPEEKLARIVVAALLSSQVLCYVQYTRYKIRLLQKELKEKIQLLLLSRVTNVFTWKR